MITKDYKLNPEWSYVLEYLNDSRSASPYFALRWNGYVAFIKTSSPLPTDIEEYIAVLNMCDAPTEVMVKDRLCSVNEHRTTYIFYSLRDEKVFTAT